MQLRPDSIQIWTVHCLFIISLFNLCSSTAESMPVMEFFPQCVDDVEIQADLIYGRSGLTTCSISCPHDNEPVCGSDGNEYINACYLCRAACLHKRQNSKIVLLKECDGRCPCDGTPNYELDEELYDNGEDEFIHDEDEQEQFDDDEEEKEEEEEDEEEDEDEDEDEDHDEL
ncbi:uncharacterized protein [Amphiura filiformis]|uniref:uncharacterized protein n=1 Tax=Amphiura filiformis TaxID=82378 RepID=UPI003B21C7CC